MRRNLRATSEVGSGLEGVVAFATEIAELDEEGSALRYRDVDSRALPDPLARRGRPGPSAKYVVPGRGRWPQNGRGPGA